MVEILKNEARSKIVHKLSILEQWAQEIPWQRQATGEFVVGTDRKTSLEYFPKSTAAFAAWNGEKNSPFIRQSTLSEIQSVSRDTLNNEDNHDLRVRVDCVIALVKLRAKEQSEKEVHSTELVQLKREIDRLRLLERKSHQEIGDYQCRLADLTDDYRKVNKKLQETLIEAKRKIAALEAQVASLTVTVRKTTALRKHETKLPG